MNMLSASDLKLIAIVIISFGSYFFGILPNVLGVGRRLEYSVLFSSVLCFGGGVLFATSIIHILPDIRKDLSDWTELVFCFGYLLIYFVDTIIVTLASCENVVEKKRLKTEAVKKYGSAGEGSQCLVDIQSEVTEVNFARREQCLNLSMLLAFSIHSLLEGLVIGVESTPNGVLLLLTAVCCHKLLVAFCLGAELSTGGKPLYALLPQLSVFVGGSAIGIALGIFLHPSDSPAVSKIVPVLQGFAGGTLLYIVVTEILPREKAKKLPRYAALFQFVALSCGFLFMSCLSALI